MGIPLSELQERVSSREFSEYLAFSQLEPWGEEIEWHRIGVLACTIANCLVSTKGKSFKPEDFIPKFFEEEKEPPTREEQKATFELLKAMLMRE